jgi:hypothetical protein
VLIRIEGSDLPGRTCGPGPDFPDGHPNIHVAVQGCRGPSELFGPVPGDVASVVWELTCTVVSGTAAPDLRGPQVQGTPGKRFVYLNWGVVDADGGFVMFRRAKLWLDAIPPPVMAAAVDRGVLVGRLGLSDDQGRPLCASVRPPRIEWFAPPS